MNDFELYIDANDHQLAFNIIDDVFQVFEFHIVFNVDNTMCIFQLSFLECCRRRFKIHNSQFPPKIKKL